MAASGTVNLSPLCLTYIGIVTVWTATFVGAMGYLWCHRLLPSLQIRRLPLVFTALSMLHIYGVLCYIAFMLGTRFPCAIEFWIMSILLPFGFALFQIANSQFICVATRQQQFNNSPSLDQLVKPRCRMSVLDGRSGSLWQRNFRRLRAMDRITRMVIYVSIGMVAQAILTLIIYLLSRKFHPSFGLSPANLIGTDAQVRLSCARGWEWWLSIAWQLFWTWLYAPVILFQSRKIHDSHGWRLQTVLCCIVGLPASPLWLCALYLDAFKSINTVWVPPQWFAISIMLIEAITLLIPIYVIRKRHTLRQNSLSAIADWEAARKADGWEGSTSSTLVEQQNLPLTPYSLTGKGFVLNYTPSMNNVRRTTQNAQLYTMSALENALKCNSEPLQQYAALRDFSGENISFLTNVIAWQNSWPKTHPKKTQSETDRRHAFNEAVRIYAAFASPEYAQFPINISSSTLKQLEAIFGVSTEAMLGRDSLSSSVSSATPFDFEENTLPAGDEKALWSSKDLFQLDSLREQQEIPSNFGPSVFTEAEMEIKYLVLTNTWPKFVEMGICRAVSHSSK